MSDREHFAEMMAQSTVLGYVLGGATCEECGYKYASVDDFIAKGVIRGYGDKMNFVCGKCWPAYEKKHIEITGRKVA